MSGALDDVISIGTLGLVDGGDVTGSNAANASDKAAQLQYQATQDAIKFQKETLAQQREDFAPFRGLADRNVLHQYRKLGMNVPDYSYNPAKDTLLNNALNRTQRAVMDSQAAQGKLGSGSTLQSLMESMAPMYMQRQDQMFNRAYNIQNQRFNQLQNLVSGSQNAAAMQGAATQNATNNINSLGLQGANALASGVVGGANAYAQGANNLMGLGMMGLNILKGG